MRNGEFDLPSARPGKLRQQQRDHASHKRRRDARSTEGEGLAFDGEARDASAGRAQTSPPDRTAQVRIIGWSASIVTSHDGDDPGMPGNGGTAESALIASRRDHNHTTPDRLIERLFERPYPVDGRLRQSEAQIDHPRARIDTVEDRRREFLGRCARHGFGAREHLSENGPYEQSTIGADGGGWRTPLRREDSRDKSPMQAGHAFGLRTLGAVLSWNFVEPLARQIGMLGKNWPVDEPDFNRRATARLCH